MDQNQPVETNLQSLDLETLMDRVEAKIDREIGFIKAKTGEWITDYNNFNVRSEMTKLAAATRKEAIIKLINFLESGANLGDTDPAN